MFRLGAFAGWRNKDFAKSEVNIWTGGQGDLIYHLGEIEAVQGHAQEAVRLLEQDISWEWTGGNPYFRNQWLQKCPLYDPIREDAGFEALVKKARKDYESYVEDLRPLVREKEVSWELKLELEQ